MRGSCKLVAILIPRRHEAWDAVDEALDRVVELFDKTIDGFHVFHSADGGVVRDRVVVGDS